MDESDVQRSDVSTRRPRVQSEMSGIWVLAFDGSGAEEDCVGIGHCTGAQDIVQKLRRSENLVVNACYGTFSVSTACMLLPKHRRFIGCEGDSSRLSEAMPQLGLLYARQALTNESNIDGKGQVRSSADVYDKVVEAIEVQK